MYLLGEKNHDETYTDIKKFIQYNYFMKIKIICTNKQYYFTIKMYTIIKV